MKKYIVNILFLIAILGFAVTVPSKLSFADTEENRYYLGETVNAGNNNGFSENNAIDDGDPHYGWDLGKFTVNGYTQVLHDKNGIPVFLKNVGDDVALWYNLKQNIDKLNDDENLSISTENEGWDSYFNTKKTDFGRGCLIIRLTDYHNEVHDPQMYINYLEAKTKQNANTKVEICEEGDYEVALDYEVQTKQPFWRPNSYDEYREFFRFKVRNGNSMVFLRDVNTKAELNNASFTENGFFIDLAKSRYLDVIVKKEVLKKGTTGLVEDTRFNRPAKDGEEYTEEGVYSITVKNEYTQEETSKKIYVGKDSVLKAYVTMGLPIEEIQYQLDKGATIGEDGVLVADEITVDNTVEEEALTGSVSGTTVVDEHSDKYKSEADKAKNNSWLLPIVICSVLVIIIVLWFFITRHVNKNDKRKNRKETDMTYEKTNEKEKR